MWIRAGAAVLAAALTAGCDRGGGGTGETKARSAEARQDSVKEVQQALRDSGVSVDTQKIDTGGTKATPAADN